MDKVGLIVAMPLEARPLLRRARAHACGTIAGRRAWRFRLPTAECTMVLCGIGWERARDAASTLIESERPDLLVSFGLGGGVWDDARVGDVVVGEKVTFLDEGGFSPSLPLTAASLAGNEVTRGAVITSRLGAAAVLRMPATLTADFPDPVLDMETYGVAQTATRRGIPVLALRSLSDSPHEPLPFELAAVTDRACRPHLLRLLAWMLLHPRVLLSLARLQRNAAVAAENAARAVIDALSRLPLTSEPRTMDARGRQSNREGPAGSPAQGERR